MGWSEAMEIERRWLQGWCERARGGGTRTRWLPAQRVKLKEELAARLAEVEALGKDPNGVRFDEVFAEVERCISNEYLYPDTYESVINLPDFPKKYQPTKPIPTSLYARMRWRVTEKARAARFVGDAFEFLTKQLCKSWARRALASSALPLVLGRFGGLLKLLQDTIDRQWSRHREAAEKVANEGIAVKIDTFSQSGGAAQVYGLGRANRGRRLRRALPCEQCHGREKRREDAPDDPDARPPP
eukprot:scaffold1331_cov203-Pinguiococcus_pyrenoidosus.AAC.1